MMQIYPYENVEKSKLFFRGVTESGVRDTVSEILRTVRDGGDAALRDVGGLLHSLPLPGGFAARYAGDEFILVQLVDSEEEITAVAQELRQRTEAFNRTHRRPYHLSFSMGCSLWRPGENLDTFLRHMDERMYAEKRAKSLPR